MSDKLKVGEYGRYIMAAYDNVANITNHYFNLKKPDNTEVTLATSYYSGVVDDGTSDVYVGYRYQIASGLISQEGDYLFESYIQMNNGYYGRRDCLKVKVYDEFKRV